MRRSSMGGGSYTRRAMSLRPLTALVAALALWPAAASAQNPSSTPGPARQRVRRGEADLRGLPPRRQDRRLRPRASGSAGRAGHDRARLRHRLPRLPRSGRGGGHAPRRRPLRRRRDGHGDRHGHRDGLPDRHRRRRHPAPGRRTTAPPTTARSRRRTTAPRRPRPTTAPCRRTRTTRSRPRRPRLPAPCRRPPRPPSRPPRRRSRRRPSSPRPRTGARCSSRACWLRWQLLARLRSSSSDAIAGLAGGQIPHPRNVGGFHRLAAPRAMTV